MLKIFYQKLFEERDSSGIILWRILLGFLLVAEAWGAILTSWMTEKFVEPSFRFTFIGFEFLSMLSGPKMYAYNIVMGFFGLFFMLGWKYRFSAIAYFIMWAGIYFGQKSSYNNHYYLLLLLVGIMIFIPANTYASLDVRKNPALKKLSIPYWTYFVLQMQFAIVYFSAVLAKLHPDWLQAMPLKLWLSYKSDYWLIGPILQQEWMLWLMAYGGIFYDATIIPLLLFRKTRYLALGLTLVFHLSNSAIFQIGIFPFMAISAIVLYWDPTEIKRMFFRKKEKFTPLQMPREITFSRKVLLLCIGFYLCGQIYLPLRHHFYEGNVNWTEEGHRLSWHMMTRSKSGSGYFIVENFRNGKKQRVNTREHLKPHQERAMFKRPDMIWQFSQYLKDYYNEKGMDSIGIYAHTRISLNGRPAQAIVDPNFNLSEVEKWERFKHKEWITELKD
ncbi:MAG: HTTM domain-containing protein [Chitinophagales bacterium]